MSDRVRSDFVFGLLRPFSRWMLIDGYVEFADAEPDRVDQQRRLEEALRERYARNYQEEQERRTNGAEHAQ